MFWGRGAPMSLAPVARLVSVLAGAGHPPELAQRALVHGQRGRVGGTASRGAGSPAAATTHRAERGKQGRHGAGLRVQRRRGTGG